jgi:hypothetical protein
MIWEESRKGVWRAFGLGTVVVALALAGCGSGSTPITSVIDLKSSGIQANGVIRPNVSCGAGSLWIPLEWGSLPEDTKELAIYIGRFKYVKDGDARKLVVPFADLVSKIKPSEHRLVANVLPEGVSWSYFGRLSCPPVRQGQNVLLQLFALDRIHGRAMKQRLATRLAEEALAKRQPDTAPRSPGKLTSDVTAVGRLIATYGPPQN